jgi:hypothetical protein
MVARNGISLMMFSGSHRMRFPILLLIFFALVFKTRAGDSITTPPPFPVRSIAEFEPMEGLLFARTALFVWTSQEVLLPNEHGPGYASCGSFETGDIYARSQMRHVDASRD